MALAICHYIYLYYISATVKASIPYHLSILVKPRQVLLKGVAYSIQIQNLVQRLWLIRDEKSFPGIGISYI